MISTDAMDRIIEITERNLQMQGEFLRALMELRNRFDNTDRDHKDLNEVAKKALENSFDILNKMKFASNEKIISMIDRDRESMLTHREEFTVACEKIKTIADRLDNSDRWSKRFISIATAVIISIQSVGIYLTSSKEKDIDDLKQAVVNIVEVITEKNTMDSKSQNRGN